jgi:uncharacterized protein
MAEHPNVEIVKRGFDAFVAGDVEWLSEHLHENIVWHMPGSHAFAGDYKGREAVLAVFAKQAQAFQPDFEVHDVLANDDHAVALMLNRRVRRDNGEALEGRQVFVFHVDAQGRALEAWVMNEDQAAVDRWLEGVR